MDYLDDEHKISGNCLAVGMMGMKFFYMTHDFYAGQFTKSVYPKFEGFNEEIAQWFISWFNKSSDKYLSVLVRDFEKVFNDTEIDVPYMNGEICISHIKNIIEEINRHEIDKLNWFFDTNGYTDCSLTDEEQQAITALATGNVQMKECNIKDLFSVVKGKRLTKDNMISGNTNFVGATATDNGITNHISNDKQIHTGHLITVTYNGSVGESFYQPFPFWASDDVNVLYPKEHLSENQCLYFLAPLRKKGKQYGYSFKWAKEIMENDSIYVPVSINGSIDYAFMENYMLALKKQCIARLKASDVFTRNRIVTTQVEPTKENSILVLGTSEILETDRFTRFLPLYPFHIACGALENGDALPEDDIEGWIDVSECGFKPNAQMFVVHAKGESMLPKIQPDDLCVFEAYGGVNGNAGSREGLIVIARQHDDDTDYNCQYTIKKYHSEKDPLTGSNTKVELRPLNSAYSAIEVKEDNVQIIATLKQVL